MTAEQVFVVAATAGIVLMVWFAIAVDLINL